MMALVALQSSLEEPLIPEPIVGGKGWVVERTGRFLLQKTPGTLRSISCTHTGSAYLRLWDGTTFDHQNLDVMRPMFHLAPCVLGCWLLDMGFNKGLICEVIGVMSPFATIVWVAKR